MKLKIAKINENIFDGEFESVLLPAESGEIEIFPDHAPFLSPLKSGNLIWKFEGKKQELEIEKGFVEVSKKEVVVIL